MALDESYEELKAKILDELHSVYPVCNENLDEVIGVVLLKMLVLVSPLMAMVPMSYLVGMAILSRRYLVLQPEKNLPKFWPSMNHAAPEFIVSGRS